MSPCRWRPRRSAHYLASPMYSFLTHSTMLGSFLRDIVLIGLMNKVLGVDVDINVDKLKKIMIATRCLPSDRLQQSWEKSGFSTLCANIPVSTWKLHSYLTK